MQFDAESVTRLGPEDILVIDVGSPTAEQLADMKRSLALWGYQDKIMLVSNIKSMVVIDGLAHAGPWISMVRALENDD